jgi:predicted RNase H-like HicB family nuclease
MTTKYEYYSMTIRWSIPSNAYLVEVPELPGLVTHGETYEEAIRNAQEVIEVWIDANEEWGLSIPKPRVIEDYDDDKPVYFSVAS